MSLPNQSSPPPPSSPPPEADDGEDILAGMENDYRAIPELDEYEDVDLDARDYGRMGHNARAAAESAMKRRDGQAQQAGARQRSNMPAALQQQNEYDEDSYGGVNIHGGQGVVMDADDEGGMFALEDFSGPLREWLAQERVKGEIRRRFREFLLTYTDQEDQEIYVKKIKRMVNDGKVSLEVAYPHLSEVVPILGIWLADSPKNILKLFDEETLNLLQKSYSIYNKITQQVHVRITDLPLCDNLRDLRQIHLDAFVQVKGVVTRRTSVFPQLNLVKWDCVSCGYVVGPFTVQSNSAKTNLKDYQPKSCSQCQKKVFRLNSNQTIYRNFQKITLCEAPGSVPAGRIPRSREVILQNDLCDSVRPGEQINVCGIYTHRFETSLNAANNFPVFSTVIEANYIQRDNDYLSHVALTKTDEEAIRKLSKMPDVEERIISSIAPSIYGHKFIKRAVAFALFGGQAKRAKSRHRVRGDINVLIMGDPGVAKSQFLKYTEKIAARAVYATGKGASAVGLTASVRRDPLTREWTLEGGALVLADRGVCLIDEFDKMNEQDRVSIHEAMEQQSISISKAGIVTTLQARCAVIAAANPVKGRYDSSLTFIENVDLTDPILSRFDILAVVKDVVDPVRDELLADFVVGNHIRAHPAATEEEQTQRNRLTEKSELELDQDLLKKYIVYAKKNCKPELSGMNKDKVTKFYATLRQKSSVEGSIPVAVRHIESILRMAVARAKIHMRDTVNESDVDVAIKVMLESFIETQKFSVKQALYQEFKQYMTTSTDSNTLLMHILQQEVRSQQWYQDSGGELLNEISIDLKEFRQRAKDMDITQLAPFFKSKQFTNSFVLDKKRKVIRKIWENQPGIEA